MFLSYVGHQKVHELLLHLPASAAEQTFSAASLCSDRTYVSQVVGQFDILPPNLPKKQLVVLARGEQLPWVIFHPTTLCIV
jgi:hypothetical protein